MIEPLITELATIFPGLCAGSLKRVDCLLANTSPFSSITDEGLQLCGRNNALLQDAVKSVFKSLLLTTTVSGSVCQLSVE